VNCKNSTTRFLLSARTKPARLEPEVVMAQRDVGG